MASSTVVDPRTIVEKFKGFMGGVNIRDAVNQLGPDEARLIENMVLDERGGAAKRLGVESHGTFGSSSDRVLSAYTFYKVGATPQVLIHTSAGKLYYTTDPSAGSITWTQIITGLSTTAPMSFETFNAKCYMSNGVDDYASWDGSARTAFASAPKGKYLRLWKDTMWNGPPTGTPDRVYSSAPGDAETWPAANWVDIAKGDGDQLTALGSDGTFLIFFKRDRHMLIYDPVTFANRVIDFEKGCESHFSVVQYEGEIFFLSKRGICQYFGDSPSKIISYKVDPLFDPAIINFNTLNTVYAYTIGNRCGWALPEATQTYPTLQLEYYPRLTPIDQLGNRGAAPFVFHRMPAGVFTRVRSGATETLYGAHNNANKFLKIFSTGTDDGTAFTGLVETSAFDFGAPNRTKYIRRLWALGRGKFVMQFRRDFKTDIDKTFVVDLSGATDVWSVSDLWGAGSWGPESTFKEQRINTDAFCRYLFIRFSDSETLTGTKVIDVGSAEYAITSGEWAIYGIVVEADLLGVRE